MRKMFLGALSLLVVSTAACADLSDTTILDEDGDTPEADIALDDRTEPEGPEDEPAPPEPPGRTSCDGEIKTELTSIATGFGKKLDDNGAPGYAIVVSRRHPETKERCVASAADGFARSIADDYRPYTIDTRTPVGSISKFVMAAVTLDILDQYNVPLYATVKEYVPASWNLGDGVGDVTFHELLRHRSGITKSTSWQLSTSKLQDLLEKDIGAKDYEYNNGGFHLLMYMTARVADPGIATTEDAGDWLNSYLIKNFFSPNGIPSGPAATPSCFYDKNQVLTYPKNSTQSTFVPGVGPSADGRVGCGSALFNTSMRDLSLFAEKLHHQEVFDPYWTFVMKLNDYGFDIAKGCNAQSCPKKTAAGDVFQNKSGYLPFTDMGGFKAGVAFFPEDTIIVFATNGGDVGPSMQDAWDERVH